MVLLDSLPSMEDLRVEGLETIQPAYAKFDGSMYAGLLPFVNPHRPSLNDTDPESTFHTMFWLFEPTPTNATTQESTLVLWLNGGPGCSSFNCGVLMETSPVTQPLHDAGYCCLEASPEFSHNPYSWTATTTMLYVEHPIGTGFSYGHPYPETERDASSDLDAFLQSFFHVFPHLQSREFFVFGESYAGMFVPSIAKYIMNANQKAIASGNTDRRIIVPLAGAAIGNGWIDATIQGPATIDYSWYHGLIDEPTRNAIHKIWEKCAQDPNFVLPPPFHPFTVQDDCGIMWAILQASGNPNAYDVTTWDPNVDQVTFSSEAFFNDPKVKEMLHVTGPALEHYWHGCQAGSGRRQRRNLREDDVVEEEDVLRHHRRLYMDNDRPISVVPYIAELVDNGIPVLVYNGDRDMTTNMVGTELCLNGMEWSGKDEWLDAPRGLWNVNDYPAGWAKEQGDLTFVVVYNSGHMVPYNAPESAHDLLRRFLNKKSFIDEEAESARYKGHDDESETPIDHETLLKNLQLTSMVANGQNKDDLASAASLTDASSSWTRNMDASIASLILSMFVGVVVGSVLTAKMGWGRRRRSGQGYRPVPNVD